MMKSFLCSVWSVSVMQGQIMHISYTRRGQECTSCHPVLLGPAAWRLRLSLNLELTVGLSCQASELLGSAHLQPFLSEAKP